MQGTGQSAASAAAVRTARAVVIGAGVGGLSAAIELAARGLDVLVLERAAAPGGKMRQVHVGGLPVDAGPTVFTMRWVFEELFAAAGARLDDHLALRPVEVLARHAWSATERLDLFTDVERSADAIGAFAGSAEANGYRQFCRQARRIYMALEGPFMRSSRPDSPIALARRFGVAGLPDLWSISPFQTLWRALGTCFRDPRLRQLFGRYATYCGSSPFHSPATLMLVAHAEQEGVWLVDGGMHAVACALARVGAALGSRYRYGETVSRVLIAGGRVIGIELASGERLEADVVVMNGDVAALADGALGRDAAHAVPRVSASERSLSAVTWTLNARTNGFPLIRHNVFFSANYAREFDDILVRSRVPSDPTVYVCAQDRDDRAASPRDAPERMLCLVNAPACGDTQALRADELADIERRTFARLERCGLHVERSAGTAVVTTPADFHRLFPGTGGALYGRASHGWQASFRRPGARSRVPRLYLAGGSVHPGPGVPMAALSGRLAAAAALDDLAHRR